MLFHTAHPFQFNIINNYLLIAFYNKLICSLFTIFKTQFINKTKKLQSFLIVAQHDLNEEK